MGASDKLGEILELVKKRWARDGLKPSEPLPAAKLKNRFTSLRVPAASEAFDVYSMLNGFDKNEMDSECFSFWSVDEMRDENKTDWVKDNSFVHFADFLIFSHTYAFKA